MFGTRPKVSDLVFRLFDKPVHPELFDAVAVRQVDHASARLGVRLLPTGHVVEYQRLGVHVVECTTASDQPLPEGSKICHHALAGSRRGRYIADGVRYEMGLQVEVLPVELFLKVHDEIVRDGSQRGLMRFFPADTRLGVSPVGLITIDPIRTGIAVATFHTFPAECTIIKTQSLIEPGA